MMYADWLRGQSITAVAAANGIARQVAARIIASYHPEEDEDTDRSVYRGELWRLHDEVAEIFHSPGFKMAPAGGPAHGPDGEPALDTNVQVQAGERPAQQNIRHSHEFYVQQKDESLAALAARKAADDARIRELEARVALQGTVIPGEVVRELRSDQHRGEEG